MHRLDRAQDDRFLPGDRGNVGGDERQRFPLRVLASPRAVEDQLLAHLRFSTVMTVLLSSLVSTDLTECPSNRASEGRSSLAAGSLTMTAIESPTSMAASLRRNSWARP